jgi:hypothetical protein
VQQKQNKGKDVKDPQAANQNSVLLTRKNSMYKFPLVTN